MRFLCQINILQTYDDSDEDMEEPGLGNSSFRQMVNKERGRKNSAATQSAGRSGKESEAD